MQENLAFENLYMGINRVTYGTHGRKINPNYQDDNSNMAKKMSI